MENSNTGWTKLFVHGVQVTVPIDPTKPIDTAEAMNIAESVRALLDAGFTVDMAGTPLARDGETIEEVSMFVRREKAEDDGTFTPIIDMYNNTGKFRIIHAYLNDEVAIKDFEAATGIELLGMPLWQGSPIERGANPKTDKFIVQMDGTVKIACTPNPYWREGDKKKAKRKFARWVTSTNQQPMPAAPEEHKELPKMDITVTDEMYANALRTQITDIEGLPKEVVGKQFSQIADFPFYVAVLEYLSGKSPRRDGTLFLPTNQQDSAVALAAQIILSRM